MKKHRMAVVGCGALAQRVHLPNIMKSPRIELITVCDIDANIAEQCKNTFGAKRSETDWNAVVAAPDVDIIVLATHTNLRSELIIPAMKAGKPVYTEKPLGTNRREMVDIILAAKATGTPICVGHNRRSSPCMLEFKRMLEKAKCESNSIAPSVDHGGLYRERLPEEYQMQLLIRINDDARSWKEWIFWDEEGIMFAEMVHFIDLALWLNSGYPVRVYAEGSRRGNFTLLIKFNDGSITTLQHTMVGNFDYPKELFEATVNNVTIAMDQHIEIRQIGMYNEPNLRTFPYATDCDWAEDYGMTGYMKSLCKEKHDAETDSRPARWLNVNKGHYEHLDLFLTHIEGMGENLCDVQGAVAVNMLAVRLLESARMGIPLPVQPEDWHIPGTKT